ncbi:histidine kinase dimerization/phospho-acceptor domain-containing protein [Patiriisocius hiemis]|uniref:histidine kinase n=1 Tax=Patiriisocius hiemis TaxID=3075604 RepID=A0ABU2Y9R1_9FLAO|nr:histidine kinase dimerization/phospho-acceptor domain-containing protein [Constantimarinum sp. W242]MDT0554926.1 ATPase [Constantimarinum sp. W242]
MIAPNYPHNESERLAAVQSYNLLDTLEEEDYDSITKLISQICDVPISLITLIDTHRNFLKSHRGVDINESPRDVSFCSHAILEPDTLFIIEDSRKDPRFKENPIVSKRSAIFYAGKALVNKDGFPLGTLCIFDTKPRKLTSLQKEAIVNLSKQVVHLFELRRKNIELEKVQIELENKNKDLKNYAGIVSHDIKSPLANITALARLILEENREKFDDTTLQYFDFIEESTENLKEYANGLLQQYTSQDQFFDEAENVQTKEFFETFKDIHMLSKDEFKYPTKGVLKKS